MKYVLYETYNIIYKNHIYIICYHSHGNMKKNAFFRACGFLLKLFGFH